MCVFAYVLVSACVCLYMHACVSLCGGRVYVYVCVYVRLYVCMEVCFLRFSLCIRVRVRPYPRDTVKMLNYCL